MACRGADFLAPGWRLLPPRPGSHYCGGNEGLVPGSSQLSATLQRGKQLNEIHLHQVKDGDLHGACVYRLRPFHARGGGPNIRSHAPPPQAALTQGLHLSLYVYAWNLQASLKGEGALRLYPLGWAPERRGMDDHPTSQVHEGRKEDYPKLVLNLPPPLDDLTPGGESL